MREIHIRALIRVLEQVATVDAGTCGTVRGLAGEEYWDELPSDVRSSVSAAFRKMVWNNHVPGVSLTGRFYEGRHIYIIKK